MRPAANDETLILSSWNGVYAMFPNGSIASQLYSAAAQVFDPTTLSLSPEGAVMLFMGNLVQVDSPTSFHFLINQPSSRGCSSLAVDNNNRIILLDGEQARIFHVSATETTPLYANFAKDSETLILSPSGNLSTLYITSFALPDQFNIIERDTVTGVDTFLFTIGSPNTANQFIQVFSAAADQKLYATDGINVYSYSLITRQNSTLFNISQVLVYNYYAAFEVIATGTATNGETIVFVQGGQSLIGWTASGGLSVFNLRYISSLYLGSTLVVDSARQMIYLFRATSILELYSWNTNTNTQQPMAITITFLARFSNYSPRFATLDRFGNVIMLNSDSIMTLSIADSSPDSDSDSGSPLSQSTKIVLGVIGGIVGLAILLALPRIIKHYQTSRAQGERSPLLPTVQNQ